MEQFTDYQQFATFTFVSLIYACGHTYIHKEFFLKILNYLSPLQMSCHVIPNYFSKQRHSPCNRNSAVPLGEASILKMAQSRLWKVKWLACLWETKDWAPVSELQPRHRCELGGVGRSLPRLQPEKGLRAPAVMARNEKGRHCGWMPLPDLGWIQTVIPSKI